MCQIFKFGIPKWEFHDTDPDETETDVNLTVSSSFKKHISRISLGHSLLHRAGVTGETQDLH